MALTLTVEDGSIVANANSYASLDQIKAYNAQRNVALPTTGDDAIIALAMQAMDYLEAYEPRWKGDRAQPLLQALSWPRQNVYMFGRFSSAGMWPVDGIPSSRLNVILWVWRQRLTCTPYKIRGRSPRKSSVPLKPTTT